MKHSREFDYTMAQLRKKEMALRSEIDADSQKMAQSGKKILAVFAIVVVALFAGGVVRLGRRRKRSGRRGQYRWIGRLLEFLIPFIFSSIVNSRVKRRKELSDS
ncbi:MAG: hypothetical protein AAGA85_06050 [Bacteroidota bacterium]